MILIKIGSVHENWNSYNLKVTDEELSPIRMTRQRRAVQEALATSTTFCSAQDLHATLRTSGATISLATVYNQLRQMADRHEVDLIRTEAGEALWRRCGAGQHHHHLVCRSCGAVIELEAPAVERWAGEVAKSTGFTELSHSVEISGICPACARG
jgi:Fur family ferric uptake transcriptional regulator